MKEKEIIPVKKNDVLEVTIEDLSYEGLGVAKLDRFPIFVENALPKEVVQIKIVKVVKKFAFAIVLEYIKTAENRVEADKKLLQTGIAPLQHLAYEDQLIFKQKQVKNALEKIAKMPEVPVSKTIGMEKPFGYRNKAQVPVRRIEGQLKTGFFRKNSHDLIPITDFYIQNPKIDEALQVVVAILQGFNVKAYNEEQHEGFLRHIIIRYGHYSHEMMVILVTRKDKFFKGETIAKKIAEELPEVVSVIQNVNEDKTNVILGKVNHVLYGKESYRDTLLGNTYEISAPSFYQVNTEQTEKLYETAIDFADVKAHDVVVDAYCGIGTIGLSLAKKVAQVYGVEVVPEAIADAKRNALINGIDNVTYKVGKAEEVMAKWQDKKIKPSVVMVDPPRKGLAESFIDATIAMKPEKIVYVSCNPATFARDVALFKEKGGYDLQKVQPVDLFPQTTHVECVGLLVKA